MPVCIAGMHRSGTSLLTRLLQCCGLYLGPDERFMRGTPDNTEGYWEHKGFVEINDEILIRLGGSWGHPPLPLLTPDWVVRPELADIRARAEELLLDFAGTEPWGWKDPRNSLTFPFWKSLHPGLKVVICLRHPSENARSLERSGSYTDYSLRMTLWNMYPRLTLPPGSGWLSRPAHPLALKVAKVVNQTRIRLSAPRREYYAYHLQITLWQLYNEALLSRVERGRRIITHYDAYFRDPRGELKRVLNFLKLPVHEEVIAHCCAAISAAQRHYRSVETSGATLPRPILDLYHLLCEEAEFR